MASKIIVDQLEKSGYTTLTLPSANATANQYIKNDGAGALSWATLPGSGKILQVIGVTKTDTFSHNTTAWADITGMSVSITPSATSSKIYVTSSISCGSRGYASYSWIKLVRDSTDVFVGDAASARLRVSLQMGPTGNDQSQMNTSMINYIDSPNTTSATTYKLQMICQNTDSQYINRSYVDTDLVTYSRGASSIIVMEVGI